MKFWRFYYRGTYYLTHPWEWVSDFYLSLKYAYQRSTRGWDDTVVWSIDYHISYYMPIWLRRLKETKQGIPLACFEKDDLFKTSISPDEERKAEEKWNEILDKMILGFEAAKKIDELDFESKSQHEELMEQFNLGMMLFQEYYFSLWD